MRRRDFIKVLGGTAAWPFAAWAQQMAMPVIGIISAGSRSGFDDLLNEFRLGLKDFGYVEGQTVAFDYAFAAGRFDQLSQLANDLAAAPSCRHNFNRRWFGVGRQERDLDYSACLSQPRRSGQVGVCRKLKSTRWQ
jgi:hypothetical protein